MIKDSCLLTGSIITREFARVLAEALDLDYFPNVLLERNPLIHSDAWEVLVRWGEAQTRAEIPMSAFALSLDDFCERWVIPMVSAMCGRPLLDERGRVVLNPVHDMREAA